MTCSIPSSFGECIDLEVRRRRDDRHRMPAALVRLDERARLRDRCPSRDALREDPLTLFEKLLLRQPDEVRPTSPRENSESWSASCRTEESPADASSTFESERPLGLANLVLHEADGGKTGEQRAVDVEECGRLRPARTGRSPGSIPSRGHRLDLLTEWRLGRDRRGDIPLHRSRRLLLARSRRMKPRSRRRTASRSGTLSKSALKPQQSFPA